MKIKTLSFVALVLPVLACSPETSDGDAQGAFQVASEAERLAPIAETDARADLARLAEVVEPANPAGKCGASRVAFLGPPPDVEGAEALEVFVLHEGKTYEIGLALNSDAACRSETVLDVHDDALDFQRLPEACTTSFCVALGEVERSFFVSLASEDASVHVFDTTSDEIYVTHRASAGKSVLYAVPKKGLGSVTNVERRGSSVHVGSARGGLTIDFRAGRATIARDR